MYCLLHVLNIHGWNVEWWLLGGSGSTNWVGEFPPVLGFNWRFPGKVPGIGTGCRGIPLPASPNMPAVKYCPASQTTVYSDSNSLCFYPSPLPPPTPHTHTYAHISLIQIIGLLNLFTPATRLEDFQDV